MIVRIIAFPPINQQRNELHVTMKLKERCSLATNEEEKIESNHFL